MRILHVTTEFAPFAKAGGLAEVVVGLSRELIRQGARVEVVLPKYDFISPDSFTKLRKEIDFTTFEWEHPISNTMWTAVAENCPLYLLEMDHPKHYFQRGKIYGEEDDVPRFLYFSRAVLEYLKLQKEPIDILHLHDWHAAALAPLLREVHPEIPVKAIVLSLHNLEYQGFSANYDLAAIGLKKDQITHLQMGSHYNLLKGGIYYADAIAAVSPTYAKEILTPEYGFGLNEDLCKQKEKLTGILNGIDLDLWNPSKDPVLLKNYSAKDSMLEILAAKRENRKGLRFGQNLPLDATWIGAITRLVPQKGPFLIEAALKETIRQKQVFILVGTSPIKEMQHHFEQLKKEYSDCPFVFFHLDHDETFAHKLYAALDFIIVPSLFEPCGLTQLIGMHYGTVPIVRLTGGLKDTVFDCEEKGIPANKQNGFTFTAATSEAVIHTLKRAIRQKNDLPLLHQLLIKRGMEANFGWSKPAKEYLQLYSRHLA